MKTFKETLEEKKTDPVQDDEMDNEYEHRDDRDIDNDGDTDEQDEYLHRRRKAISKAVDESFG